MILSDISIKEYIYAGKIQILPDFDEINIRPTGIRLHLAEEILVPINGQTIDLEHPIDIQYNRQIISDTGFLLRPGDFILGSTFESIRTSRDIVGHLEGRSTIARLGLSLHCTSGIIDGNYDEPRSIVLEMKNDGVFKLILKKRMAIGMLIFSELTCPIGQESQSQYRNQNSVLPPNLHFNPDRRKKEDKNERKRVEKI